MAQDHDVDEDHFCEMYNTVVRLSPLTEPKIKAMYHMDRASFISEQRTLGGQIYSSTVSRRSGYDHSLWIDTVICLRPKFCFLIDRQDEIRQYL